METWEELKDSLIEDGWSLNEIEASLIENGWSLNEIEAMWVDRYVLLDSCHEYDNDTWPAEDWERE